MTIASWYSDCGIHFVRLVKTDSRYTLDTSLGPRYLDAHDFKDDEAAIWYVDQRVKEGSFDPLP